MTAKRTPAISEVPPPNLLRVALAYLERGWAAIPIEPRGKRPAVRWEPFQHRLPTEEEMREWWRNRPGANLGIVSGAVSGLVVLDVDPRHGGAASLETLECEHGALPDTVEAQSGGGGRHVYFAHPGGVLRNRVALRPGIDVRGDGGLVVAPPSIHASGRRYAWRPGCGPSERPLAALPGWLEDLARGPAPGRGRPPSHWRRIVHLGVEQGERNNTIASLTGHLLWHEVDAEVVLDLLLCWNRARCRPPLSDAEVAQTVENIRHTHARHQRDHAAGERPGRRSGSNDPDVSERRSER